MKDTLSRPDYNVPFRIQGHTYWLSHHAAQRAEEMGVPLKLIPHILTIGERKEAPRKYAGTYYRCAGKVSLSIDPQNAHESVITTVLWATDEAWREWFARSGTKTGGRVYRGDDNVMQHTIKEIPA